MRLHETVEMPSWMTLMFVVAGGLEGTDASAAICNCVRPELWVHMCCKVLCCVGDNIVEARVG